MRTLHIIWQLMKGNRLGYALSLVALVVVIAIAFLVPLVYGFALDYVIGGEPLNAPDFIGRVIEGIGGREAFAQRLWWIATTIVGMTAVSGALGYLRMRWTAESTERIARRLRRRLFDHLQRLPVAYHGKADTGDLVQRCTSDVETIRRFLSQQIVEIGRAVVMLLVAIPVIAWIDWRMMAIGLAMMPALIGFAVVFFPRVKETFKQSDEAEGALTTVIQENLTGIRVVRAFARQPFEQAKFGERNEDHCGKQIRLVDTMAIYWAISDLFALIQGGLVLVCGGWFVMRGSLTVGELFTVQVMVAMLLWPIRQMGRVLSEVGKTLVAVDRVQEILDVAEETNIAPEAGAPVDPAAFEGEIEFDRVTFGYDPARPTIRDLSLTIRPGETLALLGPSGSGKSTLIRLLLRLYDPDAGTIRVGGVDLATLGRQAVRARIGVVMQQPFLFSRTVRDNIALGRFAAGQPEVEEAASASCIHEAILEFEHGYETEIGERGVRLSGGQRQRMAIARALVMDPPVLALDDALSAVDTHTEELILEALAQRRHRRTTIVIAHRLSTLRRADRIAVLDRGRLAQLGTHGELLEHDGLYRRLWAIQEEELHHGGTENTEKS